MTLKALASAVASVSVVVALSGIAASPASATARADDHTDDAVIQLEFEGRTDFTDTGPVHMVIDATTNTITSVTPIQAISYSTERGEEPYVTG